MWSFNNFIVSANQCRLSVIWDAMALLSCNCNVTGRLGCVTHDSTEIHQIYTKYLLFNEYFSTEYQTLSKKGRKFCKYPTIPHDVHKSYGGINKIFYTPLHYASGHIAGISKYSTPVNEQGLQLIEFCKATGLLLMNGRFGMDTSLGCVGVGKSGDVGYRNWYQYWVHSCLINDLGSSPQPEGEAGGWGGVGVGWGVGCGGVGWGVGGRGWVGGGGGGGWGSGGGGGGWASNAINETTVTEIEVKFTIIQH